jgi:hypothetical protein
MSSNKRIFYACQAVAITNHGDDELAVSDMVHGVQSVGVNTTFNLEQAFELGQIEIYENIEGTPDIEVTLEKVLDGYPLIYHMATVAVENTTNSGLAARSKEQCDLRLGIFDESSSNVASAKDNSGKAEVEIYCSGLFVSSVSYTVPVDGNATESVTLIGNNKTWLTAGDVKMDNDVVAAFNGSNIPKALGLAATGVNQLAASGGIQRREDVMLSGCIFPRSINGVEGSGYGNALNFADGSPRIHVQSFSCSTDFSREDVFELGRKTPYYRPASFPVEVSTEIEAITISGDFISATEAGDSALHSTVDSGNNTQAENIFLLLRCGYAFDLGNKNRLASLTYGGGDAGGGNVSVSYSYTNFNELDVQDWTVGGYIGFDALKQEGFAGGIAGGFPTGIGFTNP